MGSGLAMPHNIAMLIEKIMGSANNAATSDELSR